MKKVVIQSDNITQKQWANLILELNLMRKAWKPYAKIQIVGRGVKKIVKHGTKRYGIQYRSNVPRYSGIFGQIFFSVIKKNSWHRWHRGKNRLKVLVLANNRCATTLNYGGTAWHKWRIY